MNSTSSAATNDSSGYSRERETIHGYELGARIGSGATSHVYKASKDGQQFAIKFINDAQHQLQQGKTEIENLNKVKSLPCVARPVEVFFDDSHRETQLCIVSELAENKDLFSYVQHHEPLPAPVAKNYVQ